MNDAQIQLAACVKNRNITYYFKDPLGLLAHQGPRVHVLYDIVASRLHQREEVLQRGELVLIPVVSVVDHHIECTSLHARQLSASVESHRCVVIRSSWNRQSGWISIPWMLP